MTSGINERITIFREYKSLKQTEFAKLIKVSRSTLSEIENRISNMPSTPVILSIADVFNDINIEWLLTGKGAMLKVDTDDTQSIDIEEFVKQIEPMNDKQRHKLLKIIIEEQRIYELEKMVMQLTEQNNQ